MKTTHFISDEQGQGAATLFLAVMALALLFFGAVELARGVMIRQVMDTGVVTAVRGLSIDPSRWGWAVDTIRAEVDANILGGGLGSQVAVTPYDENGVPLTPAGLDALQFGAGFSVRAEVPFQAAVPFMNLPGRIIAVQHGRLVERYP